MSARRKVTNLYTSITYNHNVDDIPEITFVRPVGEQKFWMLSNEYIGSMFVAGLYSNRIYKKYITSPAKASIIDMLKKVRIESGKTATGNYNSAISMDNFILMSTELLESNSSVWFTNFNRHDIYNFIESIRDILKDNEQIPKKKSRSRESEKLFKMQPLIDICYQMNLNPKRLNLLLNTSSS